MTNPRQKTTFYSPFTGKREEAVLVKLAGESKYTFSNSASLGSFGQDCVVEHIAPISVQQFEQFRQIGIVFEDFEKCLRKNGNAPLTLDEIAAKWGQDQGVSQVDLKGVFPYLVENDVLRRTERGEYKLNLENEGRFK